ncbi:MULTISPECIES: hypothetical protein [unclassified Mycobacterium]|uniref:hypothetical protein n=1 Tax=unclassified Mycobacterium TaxID=2642494 RepID=UPI002742019D|nr:MULTISPECIES: hypothetical protein [unclassified Mycobacterium]MDP7703183.1 hypothetical protein [Mycobacterium sp. TY815]MDP7721788.1 hypothetical protein [Mycobacterium sp. TY814]
MIPADEMTGDARSLVAELLELRGQPIALTPVAAGAGAEGRGRDYAPAAPRPAQVFAKFKTSGLDGAEHSQTDRGTSRKFQFDMIGAYDAVIGEGDTWEDDAASYEVQVVDRTQPYQVKATVTAWLKVAGHSFG